MRVSFDEMVAELARVLEIKGFEAGRARESAILFAKASADGVYSHGLNRFPRMLSYIDKGYIDVKAGPVRAGGHGGYEQWDGRLGMGNLNARQCMDRAVELAREHGIGYVGLRNTNHWMRGGNYGWQAADAGCVAMCWTNTQPNMPPWGAKNRLIGNNPFILAVPHSSGRHVVVDCAMAQFSYGKIEEMRMKNEPLPVAGGYDQNGELTCNAADIEKTWRVLPAGFWKGSGLSIALDLAAAVLAGGKTVLDVGRQGEDEYAMSQAFLTIDPRCFSPAGAIDAAIDATVDEIKSGEPVREGGAIYYPGELEWLTRKDNMENGIPVVPEIWERIKAYESGRN